MVTRSVFFTLTTFQPFVESFGLNLVSRLRIPPSSESSDGSYILALGRDGVSAASPAASLTAR